jgi:hypothetical protein
VAEPFPLTETVRLVPLNDAVSQGVDVLTAAVAIGEEESLVVKAKDWLKKLSVG